MNFFLPPHLPVLLTALSANPADYVRRLKKNPNYKISAEGMESILEKEIRQEGAAKTMLVDKVATFLLMQFGPQKNLIEKTCLQYGHELLFLPLYHPELQPTDLLWNVIKGNLSRQYSGCRSMDQLLQQAELEFL